MMTIPELDQYISDHIQGVFGQMEMAVLKEEIEKLNDDEIYLEVGVDEGRSLTVARHYAKDTVWTVGVDIIDPSARSQYMNIRLGHIPNGQGMICPGSRCVYVHSDAKMFASLWQKPIALLFIDGDHSYEGVKGDTLLWEPKVKPGGVILYHDYDHPETKRWLDEYYGDKKEVIANKIVRVRV